MLASLSSSLTSQVASHGAYAVFVLMLIDAVFPAASELVMLYAGAVAAGVFASAHHGRSPLADGVSAALSGSSLFLAVAVLVVTFVLRPTGERSRAWAPLIVPRR